MITAAVILLSRARSRSESGFSRKRLFNQIHPVKLATDIGVTPIFLFFLWEHRVALAIFIGFVPSILVSAAMMIWPPDLEKLKNSALGKAVKEESNTNLLQSGVKTQGVSLFVVSQERLEAAPN